MPSTDDVIKRLIWQFSSTGADKVADDLGKVNAEQTKLAINSEKVTKSSLDLEQSFDKLERRFDATIRAQQDYEKVQQKVNAAVAQHPELQQRANNVLDKARDYFDKAGSSASGFSKLLDKGRESLAGFALEGGPVGALLGSFGPWGIAAAAGIGLVTKALDYMNEGAKEMGDKADALKTFAENTGLTVTQIRGLTQAGAEVGMSADKVGSAMEKFTANLQDAREGTGALYDGLRRIDSGLADEVAAAPNAAKAMDAVIKAINATADATTKLNIAKAAFGKGGASMTGVADIVGDAGGVDAYTNATVKASGVTSELIERVAKLRNETKALEEANKLAMQAMYSAPVLERQKQFAEQNAKIIAQIPAITAAMTKQGVSMFGDVEAAGGIIPPRTATDSSPTINKGTDAYKEQQNAIEGVVKLEDQANIIAGQYNQNVFAISKSWGDVSVAAALQLDALQRQLSLAQAVTAEQKMQVQYENDIAEALLKVDNEEDAIAIAETKRSVAQANANAAIEKQTSSLEDQTRMIKAVANGTGDAEERAQAYQKAIDSGADATHAAAAEAATLANQTAKAAANAGNMAQAMAQAAVAADAAAQSEQKAAIAAMQAAGGMFGGGAGRQLAFGGSNLASAGGAQLTFPGDPNYYQYNYGQQGSTVRRLSAPYVFTGGAGAGAAFPASQFTPGVSGPGNVTTTPSRQEYIDYALQQGGPAAALAKALSFGEPHGTSDDKQASSMYESEVDAVFQLLNATASKTDQIANIQSQIGFERSLTPSVERAQKIAALQNSIEQLTNSTNTLNATNQELLSPYYTQDPRTSHIGFRSQGMAAGGYVDVPGGVSANDNLIASIPVASGERIYVDPMTNRRSSASGGNVTINISSPIVVNGSINKDEFGRTLYQSNQTLAKQVRSATQ